MLLQVAVLVLLLVAAVAIAVMFPPYGALAVPAAAVGAVALVVHPLFAFSLYAFILLFKSSTFEALPISPNQVLAPLFFLSTFFWYLRGRGLRIRSPLMPILLVVMVYFTSSAALGQDTERGLLHARYVVIYFLLGLSIATSLKTERAIVAFAWIIVGVLLIGAGAGLYENIQGGLLQNFSGNFGQRFRVKGWAPNSIYYAWQMVFGLPFAMFVYSQSRGTFGRFFALAATAFLVVAASLTFNRQTFVFIGLLLLLSAIFYTYQNRKLLLTLVAGLALAASATILPIIIKRLLSIGNLSRDISYLERRDSLLIGQEMIDRHPFFGVGLGSFPAVWKNFLPADYSTFISQYREPSFEKFPDIGYLQITAETGLIGLILLLILFGSFGYAAWKHWRLSIRTGDNFVRNVSALVLILMAYIALSSAIQDTFLYTWIWMVYGLGLLLNNRMLPPRQPGNLSGSTPSTAEETQ